MRKLNSLITALVLTFSGLVAAGCATTGDDDGYGEIDDEAAAAGTFNLWRTESDGQYRFHLVAGNKNILLTSEGYTTRTNAINGLLSVIANGVDPAQYEVAVAKNGKHFLRLRATNGQIIGFTQLYASKSNATRAVGSCVRAVTSYLDRKHTNLGKRAHAEVAQDDNRKFSFTVFDKKGQVVVASHAYATEQSAWNGAFAIQEGAAKDTLYKVVETGEGFAFTAVALNGAVVATSPTFATRTEAAAALQAARALLPTIDLL